MKAKLLLLLVPIFTLAQTIEITVDRTNSLYKCGEPATITLLAKDADNNPLKEGTVRLKINDFADPAITNAVFDLSQANPVSIVTTLNQPGFILCSASAKLGDKDLSARYGIGFSPELIKPGSERPTDFDAFWDASIRRLAQEVPLDPQIERLDNLSSDKYDSFKVSFATFDNKRVYGFLCIPKGDGPFPVRVNVPGAGPGVTGPQRWYADQGYISLVMNVHPFEPAVNSEAQKEKYEEQNKELRAKYNVHVYSIAGATSKESYFYYPIILGINRAVDWLATQEKVDKSDFGYSGSSQGGGFGFYLCALNRNFTKGVFHVPALTDLLGSQRGGASGWPKLVENTPQADKAAATLVAPYFDSVHFAPRITCPVRVSVGFIDTTCPPAAVYAGYNMLKVADRDIVHGIKMPHSVFSEVANQLGPNWLNKK